MASSGGDVKHHCTHTLSVPAPYSKIGIAFSGRNWSPSEADAFLLQARAVLQEQAQRFRGVTSNCTYRGRDRVILSLSRAGKCKMCAALSHALRQAAETLAAWRSLREL